MTVPSVAHWSDMRQRAGLAFSILTALATLPSCGGTPEDARREIVDALTHQSYAEALANIGLDQVALGRDWVAAANRALAQPIAVTPPFAEAGYLAANDAAAVGFRFDARRGRKLVIDVTFDASPAGRLFVDLFEVRGDGEPRRVGGLSPGQTTLEYDVRRDAPHVLRLQPELLRGGRYTVSQRTLASVAPPVRDFRSAAVRSGFGAPRDGGMRDHHGIDIFRPRGTPVIAAADGYAHVEETPRGGRVIWLRDARSGRRLYYAHLDDWAIAPGTFVRTGDVIGYVGNTGNARTTPPHLHFGVYDRGPADPVPFLSSDDAVPRPPLAEIVASIGRWMRVSGRAAAFSAVAASASDATPVAAAALASAAAPFRQSGVLLPRGTLVWTLAAIGDRVRVELPDGSLGVVRARDLVDAATPLGVAAARGAVRDAPLPTAPVIDTLTGSARLPVLGHFGRFSLVRLPNTRTGWMDISN